MATLPLSSGLPQPTTLPAALSEIPMMGSYAAPMRVEAPATVDELGETSRAYKLSDQMMQHRARQEDEQDRLSINEYVKNGGNFGTPQGLMKASEDLRGKISAKSYQELVKSAQDSQTWQAKISESYAKMPEQQFKQLQSQNDLILQQLERANLAYKEAAKTKGEPAALEDFEAAKKASIQYLGQLKTPDGKPIIAPDFIQSYANMSPAMVDSMLQTSKFHQDRVKEAADIKLKGAQAARYEKLAAAPVGGAGGMGGNVPSSLEGLSGQELLDSLPEGTAAQVKAIAEGRMSISDVGIRGPARERLATLVAMYDPNYSSVDIKTKTSTERAFAKGKEAGMVRSFNVALDHLDTLQKAGTALKNKEMQAFNKLSNQISSQFGQPAPTDFDAVKKIVADEIVKSIVGSGGGVADRQEAARAVNSAMSPEQLTSVINQYKELMKGQLNGLRDQYQRGTGKTDFDEKFLSEKARSVAHGGEKPAGAAGKGAGGGEGGPVRINSPEDLKNAVAEGRLRKGQHFIGPDGQDRVLKKEPE